MFNQSAYVLQKFNGQSANIAGENTLPNATVALTQSDSKASQFAKLGRTRHFILDKLPKFFGHEKFPAVWSGVSAV